MPEAEEGVKVLVDEICTYILDFESNSSFQSKPWKVCLCKNEIFNCSKIYFHFFQSMICFLIFFLLLDFTFLCFTFAHIPFNHFRYILLKLFILHFNLYSYSLDYICQRNGNDGVICCKTFRTERKTK